MAKGEGLKIVVTLDSGVTYEIRGKKFIDHLKTLYPGADIKKETMAEGTWAFEIAVNGKTAYSKLQRSYYPNVKHVEQYIDEVLAKGSCDMDIKSEAGAGTFFHMPELAMQDAYKYLPAKTLQKDYAYD